jgi:hypothetical protein
VRRFQVSAAMRRLGRTGPGGRVSFDDSACSGRPAGPLLGVGQEAGLPGKSAPELPAPELPSPAQNPDSETSAGNRPAWVRRAWRSEARWRAGGGRVWEGRKIASLHRCRSAVGKWHAFLTARKSGGTRPLAETG